MIGAIAGSAFPVQQFTHDQPDSLYVPNLSRSNPNAPSSLKGSLIP